MFGLFIDAEIRNVGDNDALLRGGPNVNAIRFGASDVTGPGSDSALYDRGWNFG